MPADTHDRAEQEDHRRQIVGTEIEQRSAADLVIEIGIGVVTLDAVGADEGGNAGRFADDAPVHQFPNGLPAAAQEGVGCIADGEVFLLGKRKQPFAVPNVCCKRLFGVDMLSGFERLQADLGMNSWDGEVQDTVDRWIVEDGLGHAGLRYAMLFGLGFGLGKIEAGAGNHVDRIETGAVFEIDVADATAADQPDAKRLHAILTACSPEP